MTPSTINVLTKQPGCMYRERILPNTLEAFQETVGGYIECITIRRPEGRLVIVCDEEGRIKGKEPNCAISGISFCGPIIVCGERGEEFADVPVDIASMSKITEEAQVL